MDIARNLLSICFLQSRKIEDGREGAVTSTNAGGQEQDRRQGGRQTPLDTFEEGEFGIECLIPVVSELGAFYSASELEDPLFLGATFTGS